MKLKLMVYNLYFGPLPKHQFFKSVYIFSVLILFFISLVDPINVRRSSVKIGKTKLSYKWVEEN